MIYDLTNEYDREKFKQKCNELFSGRLVVDMKRVFPKRSLNQNSYLHVLLAYFACETGYTLEEVKYEIFKIRLNRDIFRKKRINKRGAEIEYTRSSSELTTQEMTLAIDRFRDYSSSEAGIYLPTPDEHRYIIHMRQEIERNKEFIQQC